MAIKTIAVIEGDDAAPEAVRPVVALLDSLNIGIEWRYPEVGDPSAGVREGAPLARKEPSAGVREGAPLANKEHAEARTGSTFPATAKQIIDDADTTLFGATSGKAGAALHYLRWGKDTYANVRPCRFLPGCLSPLAAPEGIDFVIVRENLEDLYVGVEGDLAELAPLGLTGRTTRRAVHELGSGRYAVKAITREGTERVVRFALELAAKRRGKLTCATKHNMLRETDGLFLEVARKVAAEYPNVAFESYIVDDFACRMIREPQQFDVVVMPNQYGDILSDAAAGLLGSLGLAPSGCYGDDYAYFEPAHGTAPDIAGRNIINPTATILSATMMLEYLGFSVQARQIEAAVERVYAEGPRTPDQGGAATTTEFCQAVARAL